MKIHIFKILAVTLIIISTCTPSFALAPRTDTKDTITVRNLFTSLSKNLTADEQGRIRSFRNPFDINHFSVQSGNTQWNPAQIVLEAYRRSVKELGIEPRNSGAYLKIHGSTVYTGSTRHSDDMDIILCDTNLDAPVAQLRPVLIKHVRQLLTRLTSRNPEIFILKYKGPVVPRGFVFSPMNVDMMFPQPGQPDQSKDLQLNIILADDDEHISTQKRDLLFKCLFDIEGNTLDINRLSAQAPITVDNVAAEAENFLRYEKKLVDELLASFSRGNENPFTNIYKTPLRTLSIKFKYITWLLLKEKQFVSQKQLNRMVDELDTDDEGLLEFTRHLIRTRLLKKIMETAIVQGKERAAVTALNMLENGRFDSDVIKQLVSSVFPDNSPEPEGREIFLFRHQIKTLKLRQQAEEITLAA